MDNVCVVDDGTLLEEEKNLSLEDRDAIVVDELKNLGFIRNNRLVKEADVPLHKEIKLEFEDGIFKVVSLPEHTTSIFLVNTDDKPDIFLEGPALLKTIYPNREVVEIKNPRESYPYDLNELAENAKKMGLAGKGEIIYTNTISSPSHFRTIKGSLIDVILLKDGNIRIDLINLLCKTLSFSPSKSFENALDICVDSPPIIGDIFLTGIKNGLVINHPILAQALKLQAEIGPLDRNKGTFVAHASFFYSPEEYGERFVDISKAQNISSIKQNIELLSMGR